MKEIELNPSKIRNTKIEIEMKKRMEEVSQVFNIPVNKMKQLGNGHFGMILKTITGQKIQLTLNHKAEIISCDKFEASHTDFRVITVYQ